MSISYIPPKIIRNLWGKCAGCCEYDGCNKILWRDEITKVEFNTSYIAHIIADKPNGPRGDIKLSEKLRADISNLMLLCDAHHRLVDKEDVEGHPVERLRQMKQDHERRIETIVRILPEKQSEIMLYGANIGHHSSPVSYQKAANAIIPTWYPASMHPISLGMKNSSWTDCDNEFWQIEKEHLCRIYNEQVKPRMKQENIPHLSIFALGPQPLLMLLGFLLSDIPAAEVYQLHREPPTWHWQKHPKGFKYQSTEPKDTTGKPVLVLSLSADIVDDRITSVMGNNISIWSLTIPDPHNDFLKSKKQL